MLPYWYCHINKFCGVLCYVSFACSQMDTWSRFSLLFLVFFGPLISSFAGPCNLYVLVLLLIMSEILGSYVLSTAVQVMQSYYYFPSWSNDRNFKLSENYNSPEFGSREQSHESEAQRVALYYVCWQPVSPRISIGTSGFLLPTNVLS